jgi:hypothetical protein
MVYEPLEVRAALIAGLQSDDSRRDNGDAVGISTGFAKGRGKVGKPASSLSVLSIPRYLHNLFLAIFFLRSQCLRAAPVVKEESQNSTKELKSFCYSAPIELEVTFGLSTTLVEL